MLKKTFIQILLIGVIAFASIFIITSATKAPDTVVPDAVETNTKSETMNPSGEFILETLVGAILIGTN
jgi:hypothetical protein